MSGDHEKMTCQEFQAQLAEIVGTGVDVSNHPHIQSCETCRALLRDLQTIADAARELLPIEQPKEELWERIELAIKMEDGVVGRE